jgi:diacylglycerol O-acyltransferase
MSIDRLTDLDLVMLGASKTWPQDIGALAILDGRPLLDRAGLVRMDIIQQAIAGRIHLVPRLRQVIYKPRRGLGGPLWLDYPQFDLADHVKQRRVEPPGGADQLTEAIEQLRLHPLDPTRPMWDMCFLTGLPDQRIGLYIRVHHTIADGMAAMGAIAALLDTGPDIQVHHMPRWIPGTPPSEGELRADLKRRRMVNRSSRFAQFVRPGATLHRFRRAWPAIRELLAEKPATKTSLDRMVGTTRDLALIRVSLNPVKESAHTHGATVNDFLLAAAAGGFRALLEARNEPVEGVTMRIFVPVSLRPPSSRPQQGNLIAQMVVPLRLGESDPERRLGDIVAETRSRKAKARTSLGVLMHGRLFRRLMLSLVMRQRVNATSASIPGPSTPLYLAGAQLLEVFPLLPLIANEPIGIGGLSYAGELFIGIVVDGEAFPDLAVFAEAARNDLRELTSHNSPPPELSSRPVDERSTR